MPFHLLLESRTESASRNAGNDARRVLWMALQRTGRTIVNKTGLPGKFDIHLEYLPNDNAVQISDNSNQSDIQPEATLLTAIKQQLGLQLTGINGTRQIIVIDHIEKPSGN